MAIVLNHLTYVSIAFYNISQSIRYINGISRAINYVDDHARC